MYHIANLRNCITVVPSCCSTAIVHYIGPLGGDQQGAMFGVEITVSRVQCTYINLLLVEVYNGNRPKCFLYVHVLVSCTMHKAF